MLGTNTKLVLCLLIFGFCTIGLSQESESRKEADNPFGTPGPYKPKFRYQVAEGFVVEKKLVAAMRNAWVQEEIEFQDAQKKTLDKAFTEAELRFHQSLKGVEYVDFEIAKELSRKISRELDLELSDVLLPHQRTRIFELTAQGIQRGYGKFGVLVRPEFRDRFDINRSQYDKIRLQADKEYESIKQKVNEFAKRELAAAEERIIQQLSPEQRATFEELTGDPLQFPSPHLIPRSMVFYLDRDINLLLSKAATFEQENKPKQKSDRNSPGL